jgi:hypothetical protein
MIHAEGSERPQGRIGMVALVAGFHQDGLFPGRLRDGWRRDRLRQAKSGCAEGNSTQEMAAFQARGHKDFIGFFPPPVESNMFA